MIGVSVARSFFSEERRERISGLYGVEPTIDFVVIAQLVDNAGIDAQPGSGA